eukprot:551859_1
MKSTFQIVDGTTSQKEQAGNMTRIVSYSPLMTQMEISQNIIESGVSIQESAHTSEEAVNVSKKYNKKLRILGIVSFVIIIFGFSLPFFRFLQRGKWFSSPINFAVKHPSDTQNLLTIHALSAVLYTFLGITQIIFGTLIMDHDKNWLGLKYHRFCGKYILPILILSVNITALIILFDESSQHRIHLSNIILNICACFFILIWSFLAYYFILKKNKEYLRHKDCAISIFIICFIPALFRLIRYLFQFIYYVKYGYFCADYNSLPYLMITSIISFILILFGFKNRIKKSEPHNILFIIGFVISSIFPLLTMKFNLNPCAQVNLPQTDLGVIIG